MFEEIEFNGTFRPYQQKILDGADEYLADGKINIVAAPGSGKTVLGLELIRRLGKPCLILSPTTTIREQWGDRFTGGFCGNEDMAALVSTDLKNPKPITSVTYQALYSATEKVKCSADGEEVDNSSVDIFRLVDECGIGTLCLDEAHHLQNEWQKALEKFIEKTGKKCTVISLTATPPYDASPAEWKRYISVCGEIDEEIFVPELVKSGTLCPHQDYIYFSYPSEKELEALTDLNLRVNEAMDCFKGSAAIKSVCANLTYSYADLNGWIDDKFVPLCNVVQLIKSLGLAVDTRLLKALNLRKQDSLDAEKTETALNFIISEEKLLFESEREEVKEIFKSRNLFERGNITLQKDEKLCRALAASVSKLGSIASIARCERQSLGADLRLLVLTDFIKKDELSAVGTDKKFDSISIISVFETLRRSCDMLIGALSGSLVILPAACEYSLKKAGAKFTVKPLADKNYCEFVFAGGNREKVNFVGELFERGEISALVGTKSLLGEGWDSPCVNALILASFVGSFMLSNQMRGRAIRVDKNDPEKTANIWHLATVEPAETAEINALGGGRGDNCLNSDDFETLARRFGCFVAPDYSNGKIRSGIERLGTVKPPYGRAGIERINAEMCTRAYDRQNLKYEWENSLTEAEEIRRITEVPEDRKFRAFTLYDIGLSLVLVLLALAGSTLLVCGLLAALNVFKYVGDEATQAGLITCGAVMIFIFWTVFVLLFDRNIFNHIKSENSIEHICESVLKTFKDIKMLPSSCELSVTADVRGYISVELLNASQRSQNLFKNALDELYSPIENPRYVIIPRKKFGYNFRGALACPEVFGSRREYASVLAKNLKNSVGTVEMVYTRGDKGKAFLRKCRRYAYIYESSADVYDIYGN